MIAYLLQGEQEVARRFPRLHFRPVGDRAFVDEFLRESIAAYHARLARDPADHTASLELASLLVIDRQLAEADGIYRALAEAIPEDPDVWERWSECREKFGDLAGATRSLQRTLALSEARSDTSRVLRLRETLDRLSAGSRPPHRVEGPAVTTEVGSHRPHQRPPATVRRAIMAP